MSTADTVPDCRLQIRPDFVWDAQDAYLFDIDGTLLRSRDRIHFNSFSESILAVTGLNVSLTGVVLHGGTDTAILREAFELAAVAPEVWEPHSEAILEAMRQIIETQRANMDLWTMPGVHESLVHLAGRGALLGLATGNLAQIGWTKVELVGLREWFHFGGFSDRFPLRADMVADAVVQARALLPGKIAPSICVVGDTPRDIEAARANGLAVIAVATGNYSFDDLAKMEPDACATSLLALMADSEVATASSAPSKGMQ
jgi:phosphoglycolate phosphatase